MNNLEELKKTEVTIIPKNGRKRRVKEKTYISVAETVIRSAGLLASRAVLFGQTAPFGIAFMSMERKFSVQSLITLAMVTIGYISLGSLSAVRYIGACMIYTVFLFFSEKRTDLSVKSASVAAALSVTAANIVGIFWLGLTIDGVFSMLLDLALTVLGALVFDKGKLLTAGGNIISYIPSAEEKRSVCIIAGIAALGFRGLPLPSGFSAADVLAYTIIGMGAISGGMLSGVLFGLTAGILLGLQGDFTSYTTVFGICGLVCGASCRCGKYVSAAALALSGAVLSIHTFGTGGEILKLCEAPLAAAIVTFMPNQIFAAVKRYTDFGFEMVGSDNPYKEHIRARLNMTAASFKNLSQTFKRLSDKKNNVDMQDIAELFDTAADKVCKNCSRVCECWKKDFNSTYKTMFRFLEIMEIKGKLEENDTDPRFAGRCLNLTQLVKELNGLFEIYKINRVWKNKLCENREMAGEQFNGIAEILEQLSSELEMETSFDNLAAEEIKCRLSDKGIIAKDVEAVILQHRRMVRVCVNSDADRCVITGVIKTVLGAPFVQSHAPVEEENGYITLQYNEAPGLRVTAGISFSGKSEECGDSHMLNELCGGKYLATISDGMGTGHAASLESNAIISLLDGFMEAGFDKTVAVKLINSVMVMKSAKDAFATVDMCMIDLYSGDAEFIKNGAEPSYIKRGRETETVRAASLPVGVISDVEIESFAHHLDCGDTVVMVSDGLEGRNGHEGWIKKTVSEADPRIPAQELADLLMEKSIVLKNGTADDDMTVVVLRIMPQ